LPLKKIYRSKILLLIKQLHGPPLVGLRDCMKYILLAICAIDDAIIPFWKEEVLNQKCKQTVGPDSSNHLLMKWCPWSCPCFKWNDFDPFCQSCSNPTCNHPLTQTSRTRRSKKNWWRRIVWNSFCLQFPQLMMW
jgi:hypothetical protein